MPSEFPRNNSNPDCLGLASILMLVALVGCGLTTTSYLDASEKNFGVDVTWYQSDLRIYHAALLSDRGLGLRFPGYVVGVENIHPSSAAQKDLPADQRKEHHAITHIIRYEKEAEPSAAQPLTSCVVYTMLNRQSNSVDDGHHLFETCKRNPAGEPLGLLEQSLAADFKSNEYSHVLIIVLGWNTDQEKAIKNINSLVGHLLDEATTRKISADRFRPLVIGVTWPSQWQLGEWSVVPDSIVRGLSFRNKALDSQDVGLNIVRPLAQMVLSARKGDGQSGPVKSPTLVLLGHSFGARALVTAMTGPPGEQLGPLEGFAARDRLILMEGAFEITHLFQPGGGLLESFKTGAPRLTMTSSAYDSAVAAAFWGWYAGDIRSFNEICRMSVERSDRLGIDVSKVGCAVPPPGSAFGFNLCDPTYADMKPPPPMPNSRDFANSPVRYYDASSLINCQQPFTSGGAHSDIYRRETARFLLNEIMN